MEELEKFKFEMKFENRLESYFLELSTKKITSVQLETKALVSKLMKEFDQKKRVCWNDNYIDLYNCYLEDSMELSRDEKACFYIAFVYYHLYDFGENQIMRSNLALKGRRFLIETSFLQIETKMRDAIFHLIIMHEKFDHSFLSHDKQRLFYELLNFEFMLPEKSYNQLLMRSVEEGFLQNSLPNHPMYIDKLIERYEMVQQNLKYTFNPYALNLNYKKNIENSLIILSALRNMKTSFVTTFSMYRFIEDSIFSSLCSLKVQTKYPAVVDWYNDIGNFATAYGRKVKKSQNNSLTLFDGYKEFVDKKETKQMLLKLIETLELLTNVIKEINTLQHAFLEAQVSRLKFYLNQEYPES